MGGTNGIDPYIAATYKSSECEYSAQDSRLLYVLLPRGIAYYGQESRACQSGGPLAFGVESP